MAAAKLWLSRLSKKEYFWLGVLVAVTLIIHFSLIKFPNEPIFDEQHYVPDARQILAGQSTRTPEHPSFAKLFVVLGIDLFGDNGIGWRFFSIAAGTAIIILFYLICRRLGMHKKATVLATGILAFENLTFLQASVAMLDVYTVLTIMLAFWLYTRGNYIPAGIVIGISAMTKLTGALALPVIMLHWLIMRRDKKWSFAAMIAAAPIAFLLIMPVVDLTIFRQIMNPIERVKSMLSLSGSLTFESAKHPSMSRPWEWITKPQIMPYWYIPHYVASVSFTVWEFIVPVMGFMAYQVKKLNSPAVFSVAWFLGLYAVWIPMSLVTNRISFIYYFYPTVGAICIGLGIVLAKLLDIWKNDRYSLLQRRASIAVVVIFLVLHLGVFGFFSPLNGWWNYPIPPS